MVWMAGHNLPNNWQKILDFALDDRSRNRLRHRSSGLLAKSISEKEVRARGFEPPLPCGNMALNHARLPVPPRPRKLDSTSLGRLETPFKSRRVGVPTRPESLPVHQAGNWIPRRHSADRQPTLFSLENQLTQTWLEKFSNLLSR